MQLLEDTIPVSCILPLYPLNSIAAVKNTTGINNNYGYVYGRK
jgi:hypothetical protein